jgi:uncharacterized membrane protein
MEAKNVSAGEGVTWFKCGWNLFKQDFGNWFIMFLIFVGIAIVLSFIPFIGPIAMGIISPVLIGGFMYAANRLEQGESIEIGTLFQGFRDKERMNQLLMLGVLSLIAQIIFFFIGGLLIGGNMAMHAGENGTIDPQSMMSAGMSISMLIMLLIGLILAMAFIYASPLVMLDKISPVESVKTSFAACLKNILPLLVYGIIYIVLAFIAAIPLGLGFLILIPVSILSLYCSYRSIFH